MQTQHDSHIRLFNFRNKVRNAALADWVENTYGRNLPSTHCSKEIVKWYDKDFQKFDEDFQASSQITP